MKVSSNEDITDIEFVTNEGQVLKSLDQHLREWLTIRNLNPDFYIEAEAKEMVLAALQDEYFESAYIDKEDGLVVEFKEEKDEPTLVQPNLPAS
jgi:DNA-dependent RNA polymerase auxiliary subunit epsilon